MGKRGWLESEVANQASLHEGWGFQGCLGVKGKAISILYGASPKGPMISLRLPQTAITTSAITRLLSAQER